MEYSQRGTKKMAAGKPVAQKIRDRALKRKPVALQIIGGATSEKKTWRTYKNRGELGC